MAHIKNIGLENFRVFKNKVEIDLHPITILTGANNSGKSSILKSLLLLSDNAKRTNFLELDFSGDKHNLDAFKFTKNNSSENDCIAINFQIVQFGGEISEVVQGETYGADKYFIDFEIPFPGKLDVSLKYKQNDERGKLVEFELQTENIRLFHVKYDIKNGHSVFINMDWLLKQELDTDEKLFVDEDKVKQILHELNSTEIESTINLLETEISKYQSYSIFDEKNWYKYQKGEAIFLEYLNDTIGKPENNDNSKIIDDDFFDEIHERTNKKQSLFNISNFEKWWNDNYEKLDDKLKTETKFGTSNFFSIMNFEDADYHEIISCYLSANSFNKLNRQKEQVKKIFTGKIPDKIIEKFESICIADISKYITDYNYFVYFEKFIRYVYKHITKTIDILFIESFRANTKRIYSNQSQGTDFNQLLLDVHKTKFDKEIEEFIKNWLVEFGIGEDIKFERIKGVATEVKILRKGNYIDLADLGFGTTQLIPIILNIALKVQQSLVWNNAEKEIERFIDKNRYELVENGKIRIKNFKNDYDEIVTDDERYNDKYFLKNELFDYITILIEEPETNLHPSFQSKLADLLIDASKKFNIQFIIETHSEYLIRKIQFLTAKKVIKPADTQIYYFYEPDKIPDNEQQVKKIEINEAGNLSDDFGRGFFDEADNIAINIFNMTKNQKN